MNKCECGNTIKNKYGKYCDSCRYKSRRRPNEIIKIVNDVMYIKSKTGEIFLISQCDYEKIKNYSWSLGDRGYIRSAYRCKETKKTKNIKLHIFIYGKKEGYEIDHIDQNKLNNCRDNLRYATRQQNQASNKKPKNNTTGYKGILIDKKCKIKKYTAWVYFNSKKIYLGHYKNIKCAACAYNNAAKKYFGEYAELNEI